MTFKIKCKSDDNSLLMFDFLEFLRIVPITELFRQELVSKSSCDINGSSGSCGPAHSVGAEQSIHGCTRLVQRTTVTQHYDFLKTETMTDNMMSGTLTMSAAGD